MKTLRAIGSAFVCMTIHRDLKMVHISGGEHEILCKKCQKPLGSKENEILTSWFYGGTPLFLLMFPIALVHERLTGHQGAFEHPPEHKRNWGGGTL